MKEIASVLLLLVVQIVLGQNKQPTKSQLLKVFKASIRQENSRQVSTNSNPWVICNKDSLFYKSDTLRLYNNVNYYYHSNCCEFIDWTFHRKDAFIQTRAQICKEPPTVNIYRNADWLSIKISKKENDLFFETLNQNKIIEKYKVVSIDKISGIGQPNVTTDVITLLRVGKM